MSIMSQLLSENSSSLRLMKSIPIDLAYSIKAMRSASLRGSAGTSIPTFIPVERTISSSPESSIWAH